MNAVRFQTVINEDQVIRPPEGIRIAPGPIEVIVLHSDVPAANLGLATPRETLAQKLTRMAKELDLHGLPVDLAENHDHYVHGLPKGIDKA